MQICRNCGSEIKQDDLFCAKCGESLKLVCKKCGNPCNAEDKFCERCGNQLIESAEKNTYSEHKSIKSKTKYFSIIATIIMILVAGSAGAYYYFNQDKDNKVIVEQKTNTHELTEEEKKKVITTGIIKGNDVIVRAEPNFTGSVLDYVNDGRRVKILNRQKCEDQNSAIIDVPTVIVSVDGKNVVLKKGQAVQIIGLSADKYKCQTEINKKNVYVYLSQKEFKKVYGDLWYQIQLDNNKIGWVYGEYILSEGLKVYGADGKPFSLW